MLIVPRVMSAQAEAFRGVDVTGQGYDGAFRLEAPDGRPRARTDFTGKILILTFGFTHCPDVCPTSLAALAALRRALNEDERVRVQVAFVTVDPDRDTPPLLAKYVAAFDPTFIGLRGDAVGTREAARAFHVFYQRIPVAGDTRSRDYTMDHSTGYYALDARGRTRLFFPHGLSAEDMAHDLRLLLRE
jgi:protein SCO1/2